MDLMRKLIAKLSATLGDNCSYAGHSLMLAALLATLVALPGCSGDGFGSSSSSSSGTGNGGTAPGCASDPTAPGCTVTAGYIVAVTDKVSVNSDGFDEATITATVLDSNRAAIKNVQVLFGSDRGKVSSAVQYTDDNGIATVKFTAAPDSPFNGTAIVSASVTGVGSYDVPITIVGTTVALKSSTGKQTLVVSATSNTLGLEAKLANSAGLGIYGVPVEFVLWGDAAHTIAAPAGASISPNPATTDITGVASTTLTGSTSGNVYVTARVSEFPVGSAYTYDEELFLIQDQLAFQISSPTPASGKDYVELVSDGSTQVVTVTGGLVNVAAGSTIRFTSTVGTWITGAVGGGGAYTDVTFTNVDGISGTASATIQSNTGDQGFATVYAFVVSDSARNDSITIAMSPPVGDAANITVTPEVATLFPSTATTTYSTTVRAKVYTDLAGGNYPIANVPVLLQLQNTTGGGETLAQGYGETDVYGYFETTFTSGVTSTGQIGVKIVATVATNPAVTSFTTVEIGGTPGSVAIGTPREIIKNPDNSSINTYIMSAVVADGTGAAVSGAQVTLHFWPTYYYTGYWSKEFNPVTGEDEYTPVYTGTFINEDINENGVLDPGEDVNLNGQLDPPASYAGAGPPTVTTGSDGAAPFNFIYLKDSAEWIKTRATGSTFVFGTEAKTSMEFIPKSVKQEVTAGNVNDSPFKLWLFISTTDPTGTAYFPGTAVPFIWFPGTITLKGTIDPTTGHYTLPANLGPPYVDFDTEVDNIGGLFDIYIRYVPSIPYP